MSWWNMNKKMLLAIIVIALIGIATLFFFFVNSSLHGYAVRVEPVSRPPATFTTVTNETLAIYRSLRTALQTFHSVTINYSEYRNLQTFFHNTTAFISYNNTYYQVILGTT
jgi:flagellar basal body-associated protein FliL